MKEIEPNTIEGLVKRYNGLSPKTFTGRFTTGPEETEIIGRLWEREVRRTALAFRFTTWTLSHCLDVKTAMILQHDSQGNTVRSDGSPGPSVSDNSLTELLFNDDAQTLVSMLERRDIMNHQVIQIARYPLDAPVVGSLEQLVAFDNEYRLEHPDAPELPSEVK